MDRSGGRGGGVPMFEPRRKAGRVRGGPTPTEHRAIGGGRSSNIGLSRSALKPLLEDEVVQRGDHDADDTFAGNHAGRDGHDEAIGLAGVDPVKCPRGRRAEDER